MNDNLLRDAKTIIQGFILLCLAVLGVIIFLPYDVAILIVEVLILLFVAAECGLGWLMLKCMVTKKRRGKKSKIENFMTRISKTLVESYRD